MPEENRVIQIDVDISIPPGTDVESLTKCIDTYIESLGYEVMGILQSDTSWSYRGYLNGEWGETN